MTREEALQLVSRGSSHERLRAARALARVALPADMAILRRARRSESVSFVKLALDRAIQRHESGRGPSDVPPDFHEEEDTLSVERRAYSRALQWVTASLLHEISPHLGAIKVEARNSLPAYESSPLKGRIDALDAVLSAIADLRKAATTPANLTFNLHDVLAKISNDEATTPPCEIFFQGPKDLLARGDPNLVTLAVANALRNALEATSTMGGGAEPVVISWGETEIDYWINILDHGPGINGSAEAAFKIGRTTKAKQGHTGFGLAIARQAMMSIDGSISLQKSSDGGVRADVRWLK